MSKKRATQAAKLLGFRMDDIELALLTTRSNNRTIIWCATLLAAFALVVCVSAGKYCTHLDDNKKAVRAIEVEKCRLTAEEAGKVYP